MEAVSCTAQWTAAARALESERDDRLFDDPFARTLAGDTGFALLKRYTGAGTVPFLALRTKYLDDQALAAVEHSGARQVVFVAAGMDTRAWRLPWPQDTVIYELDRPALLEAKNAQLVDVPLVAGRRRHAVAVDLAGDWAESLTEAGFRPAEPTVWVMEGLLFFLPEAAVRQVLATLLRLSAPGSVLAGDMASRASLTNPMARGFLTALREDGAAWQFGHDEPEEFLRSCGWHTTKTLQPGEEGASYGRWPYPVIARKIRDIPRSFFFTAVPSTD
ncbi:SAM-dependent methyltransferase [Streptomyces sp. SPB162]|uniref:class I SAM-dependent methyltransferase n=1 Tax=Streptomyces sp. SPB162 TaxID=2940560 RepID=UPI002404AD7B|nr:SAM-dependent methyltransferase [Streptomyces sp. SPB162]MDF9817141.1 methyltransferase (TIGR00027 family) [Streptomyces sp. SPB162]